MYINNLRINGYGNLEKKDLELQQGINVVKGNNETGKSTLLNFIFSMFYGATKNKNGRDISDFDKYKPWRAEDFSGKIKYTLDNNEQIEVFRDFNKKNPKIYNENLEDISSNFNIDKTRGNQFFTEQTGIDEKNFFSTMSVCQNEVVIDNSKQNSLIQKITNVVSSGDDNISYKKTVDKLNKRILEDVGTFRTSGRPINIIDEEIKQIESEKSSLGIYKIELQNMEEENQNIKNEIKYVEKDLRILKEIKEYKQKEILEEQKVEINRSKLNEYNKKLDELKQKGVERKYRKNNSLNPIAFLVICVGMTIASLILKNIIISLSIGGTLAVIYGLNLANYNKYKNILKEQNENKIKNNKEIEIIQENIRQCTNEIERDRQKIEQQQKDKKEYIKKLYNTSLNIDEYMLQEIEEIEQKIEQQQQKYNENMLKENSINIEKRNIDSKLESLVNKEERLQYLYEQKNNLEELANTITIAIQALEEAYTKMKNTITPKFTDELSNIIKNVTKEKYKKVNFSAGEGLKVELDSGEYVDCSRLSIGTIDQMYLALRLSILNEISKETMPIILDEAFVYYDTERLQNILKYISDTYTNRQIIIFTCTNREIETLDNLKIKYNLIRM